MLKTCSFTKKYIVFTQISQHLTWIYLDHSELGSGVKSHLKQYITFPAYMYPKKTWCEDSTALIIAYAA